MTRRRRWIRISGLLALVLVGAGLVVLLAWPKTLDVQVRSPGMVRVRVVDATTGRPVAGASVLATGSSAIRTPESRAYEMLLHERLPGYSELGISEHGVTDDDGFVEMPCTVLLSWREEGWVRPGLPERCSRFAWVEHPAYEPQRVELDEGGVLTPGRGYMFDFGVVRLVPR